MDITTIILDQHHEQRRLFAMLEQIERTETDKLSVLWSRLAAFLEVHALAEERFFYPALLELGKGVGGDETPKEETRDAIKDHNEIRDAVAETEKHPVGSKSWFDGVAATNKANSDHMGEEERQGLADFRRHVDLQTRHRIGVDFEVFVAQHITGVTPVDRDPEEYIRENT